ncbi:DUF4386 domain-containing protein [Marinomonas mediterranea]|jgi:hypothetical protein|uniref:DUF4386 domain-containing protein n=1 Tax=Marinomonas mediterranea (strain ATCC 700492 / JCM 21426 / NBRC 103028 / MMB-1) TaxID=717774 RepID=F2JYI9_MARM1|nr:DUF4386 domain-containing protein [Marinomonas mediterranea]ADZ93118.1 hypothetical protein Marme_3908 [Marinomonas mediterranea MMB-1]WCN19127.1 DUF4386 family protein [Marinomonas mediterranea MMB-1]
MMLSEQQRKQYAHGIGALYVVLLVCGSFSLMYVPSTLFDPTSAAQTIQNIQSDQWLLRMGIVSVGFIFITELFVSALIYFLFRSVSPLLALTAAFARLGNAVMQGANLLALGGICILTSENTSSEWFEAHLQADNVMLLIQLNQFGELIWEMFFACHCVIVGVLIYKSGFMPKVLGALLSIAGIGYAVHGFGTMLYPAFEVLFDQAAVSAAIIGELPFMFWLLFKGVRLKAPLNSL